MFQQWKFQILKLEDVILQGDAGGVTLGHALTSCSNETMFPVQEIPYILVTIEHAISIGLNYLTPERKLNTLTSYIFWLHARVYILCSRSQILSIWKTSCYYTMIGITSNDSSVVVLRRKRQFQKSKRRLIGVN